MNGWKFVAGSFTIPGSPAQIGYHQGTLFGCPNSFPPFGTGVSPTVATQELPGIGCGVFTFTGSLTTRGIALKGSGTQSDIGLTQFSTDAATGGFAANFMGISTLSNIGTGSLSGVITGSDGSSGTWSVDYSNVIDGILGPVEVLEYIDDGGNGSTYSPESFGAVTLNGLSLVSGVTYELIVGAAVPVAPVPAPTSGIVDYCLSPTNSVVVPVAPTPAPVVVPVSSPVVIPAPVVVPVNAPVVTPTVTPVTPTAPPPVITPVVAPITVPVQASTYYIAIGCSDNIAVYLQGGVSTPYSVGNVVQYTFQGVTYCATISQVGVGTGGGGKINQTVSSCNDFTCSQ
jgi:hypothetical protein